MHSWPFYDPFSMCFGSPGRLHHGNRYKYHCVTWFLNQNYSEILWKFHARWLANFKKTFRRLSNLLNAFGQVEENRKYRVHQIQDVVKSSAFKNSRGIFLRHTLKKGRYVVVACTFEGGQNGLHLLRIYTTASNHAQYVCLSPIGHYVDIISTFCHIKF